MDVPELAMRGLLLVLRVLLWLAWDFVVWTIAWSFGWPIWRLLTWGRFPHAGFRDHEASGWIEAVLVCGTGLVVLAMSAWWLATHLPSP